MKRRVNPRAGDPPQPASEAELVELWQHAAGRAGPMRDSLGRAIEVVYPGRLTGMAGPDLQDAIVSIDGGPARRVDVEVHLHEAGWRQHGHDADPRYAGDVLHLVWTALPVPASDGETDGKPDRASDLPPHILAPRALAGCRPADRRPAAAGVGFPCRAEDPRPAAADRRLRAALRAQGARRQAERAAVLESDIEALGPDQALYRALMRALGYSANTRQFAAVAAAAPIELLSALAGPSLGTRRVRVEAELLGAAGLLPGQRGLPAAHPHLKALERAWAAGGPRARPAVDQWTLTSVRPPNWPIRRLAGAARLLSMAPQARQPLAERLAGQVLAAAAAGRSRDLVRWFEVRVAADDYWARHWDVGRPTARPAPGLIGRARSRDLLVNAVLPFTAALGGWTDRPDLARAATTA